MAAIIKNKISKYEYKVSRSEDEKEYATPFIDNIQ
jgi:hypothetical protein